MRLTRREFEGYADTALLALPGKVRRLLYNVEIAVKLKPGREAGRWNGSATLLGLYTGLKREDMLQGYGHLPARILLYQRNIEARCKTVEEVARAVKTTLRHEIAHHFGFDEEELRRAWPEGC